MATNTTLLPLSFLVEQAPEVARRPPFRLPTDEEIRKAVLAALAAVLSDRPDVRVEWKSMSVVPLEGKPAVGRCVVCNRWVYDVENAPVGGRDLALVGQVSDPALDLSTRPASRTDVTSLAPRKTPPCTPGRSAGLTTITTRRPEALPR